MYNVLFSKFSKDRQKKFQICTSIVETENGKKVVKSAIHSEGVSHVENLAENYEVLRALYPNSEFSICPCFKTETGVEFPFIVGNSLESQIREHAEKHAFRQVKEDYKLLYDLIFSAKGIQEFQMTEKFSKVFGNPIFSKKLHCAQISNVDMIPSNILLKEKPILIDYEWVFPFAVPLEFIFARSIFLQEAVCKCTPKQQKELYKIANIEPEEVLQFYQMEVCFQEYVAGKNEKYALSKLYKNMHRRAYPISELSYMQAYSLRLEGLTKEGKWEEIFYENYSQKEIKEKIDIRQTEKYEKFRIYPLDDKSLIKIRNLSGMMGGTKETLTYSDNSDLLIIDDYYFLQPPRLEMDNQNITQIEIDLFIYSYKDGILEQLVRLIREDALIREKMELLGREKQNLMEMNEYQKQKIYELENLKVYKLYKKIKGRKR